MSDYVWDPSHYAKFSYNPFRGLFAPLYAKLQRHWPFGVWKTKIFHVDPF